MSKVMITESYLEDIADAIRTKNGSSDTYKPAEMADAIEDIPGGITPSGTINITQNGTVDVTNYASASVAVPNPSTGTKQISIAQNGTTTEDVTNYANAEITVNVSGGGSGYTFGWASITEVTIGANNVTNTMLARDFFSSYTWSFAVLASSLTTQNQIVYVGNIGTGTNVQNNGVFRYRNGSISASSLGTSYDAVLVEGTKYYLFAME